VQLVTVAALAENRTIGVDGEVPWPYLEADVQQYRERVAGSPVMLGRRTFDSMRDDLPGTRQIVVSRSVDAIGISTAAVANDVDTALELARETVATGAFPDDTVYVLGGGAIYELFQPHVDRMILSHIEGAYDGDTRFPAWDDDEWTIEDETAYDRFTLRNWVRRADGP